MKQIAAISLLNLATDLSLMQKTVWALQKCTNMCQCFNINEGSVKTHELLDQYVHTYLKKENYPLIDFQNSLKKNLSNKYSCLKILNSIYLTLNISIVPK